MDIVQNLTLLLIAGTAFWVFWKQKERLGLLEHEVRWLRQELEELKPREVRSVYD